ncbi:MAG: carbohydrate kinase [Oscillospiraceae bacterium]|nr:carbohydrate kinase [Oscillospiraceae bacterium]
MIDVVALGELLIDFTCEKTDADGYPTMAAHPGGAPANFLAALTKYGAKSALIGKVGADTFGKLLLGTLQNAGIDTRGMLVDEDCFTTLAFVTLDESGNREFAFARKPGADTRLTAEEIDYSLIDEAKVFHFGTLSLTDEPARTATQKAVAYAKEKGKLISCDPNLRLPLWRSAEEAKEQLLWAIAQADVVKISDNELEFLFGCTPEKGAERILRDFGAKLVFVTCGADGCYFKNALACGQVSAPKGLNVIDTTGAGDIFGGSAMCKLLEAGVAPEELDEAKLREIASFACAAASLSATKSGGISSVPPLREVLEKLNS